MKAEATSEFSQLMSSFQQKKNWLYQREISSNKVALQAFVRIGGIIPISGGDNLQKYIQQTWLQGGLKTSTAVSHSD